MGENAREFVKRFYWQKSIDSYDIEIRKILNIDPQQSLKKPEEGKTADFKGNN